MIWFEIQRSRVRITSRSMIFQPGDATTLKSILNEYSKDGEVLGYVVGYSCEASSDICRVADLVATRLASKHLEYKRSPTSKFLCRAWRHSFARGFGLFEATTVFKADWPCIYCTYEGTVPCRSSAQMPFRDEVGEVGVFCSARPLRTANSTRLTAISRNLAPFDEPTWKVMTQRCLCQSAALVHLWAPKKSRIVDPTSQHLSLG
jgi:hypothetical protein